MADKEADNFGPHDHLHQVLGDEHRGRVRCRPGKRNVPSSYWSSGSSVSSSGASGSSMSSEEVQRAIEKATQEVEKKMSDRLLRAISSAFSSFPPASGSAAEACLATVRSVLEGGDAAGTSGGHADTTSAGDDDGDGNADARGADDDDGDGNADARGADDDEDDGAGDGDEDEVGDDEYHF